MKREDRKKIDVHIGKRLKLARQFRDYSQTALADEIDVTFQQLQKYESGKNRIAASTLYDMAMILDIPVEYFFHGLPKMYNLQHLKE